MLLHYFMYTFLGAEFVRSDRGGLITFHGPGQLIIYPIIHLASFAKLRKSVRNYVCQLEQSVIETCRSFGVETMRTKDTGVWIRNKPLKIAAIGIHCARYLLLFLVFLLLLWSYLYRNVPLVRTV